MAGFVASIPILLIPLLLASGRVGALVAGLAGLLAAVVALQILPPGSVTGFDLLAREVPVGLWLSLQAVAFIVAGLFFYRCVRECEPGPISLAGGTSGADDRLFDRRKLYLACFLLGPFAECATGFGVGMIIALPVILSAGARGLTALGFALFSQMLVAWGSLAVGSAIGAEIAGVSFSALADRSAWLQVPLLAGHLTMFWLLLASAGHRPTAAQAAGDAAWTMMLAVLLIVFTQHVAPELGGLLATGILLVARGFRDDHRLLTANRALLAKAWPYAALTVILVATRTIPQVRDALQSLWPLRPLEGGVTLAPLYHPAAFLLIVGLTTLAIAHRTQKLGDIGGEVARLGWKPALVTVVYVVFAQLVASGGLAQRLADDVTSLIGGGAVYAAPLFAGLSGFLTGSNTASNGMMMPVQIALVAQVGADPVWGAALQNVGGSTFTMLSPTRIATGCALLGLVGQDRAAYTKVWRSGAIALCILFVCWASLA